MGDNPSQINIERAYRNIIEKYQINRIIANKLQILKKFKISFIFDDSGSMNSILQDSPLNTDSLKTTRWDELKYFAKISIELAAFFNQDGCDIYFLNREPSLVKNIKRADELDEYFKERPEGPTPLTKTLKRVLTDDLMRQDDRKLLIIICTDGEPTDLNGQVNIEEFRRCLESRKNDVYTTIVACTDNQSSVAYLNEFDCKLRNLDVVDDYRSELQEVRKVQGNRFSFTFGDYVVKSLIGSIDLTLDHLDEFFKLTEGLNDPQFWNIIKLLLLIILLLILIKLFNLVLGPGNDFF